MANLDGSERILCVPRASFERVARDIVPPPGAPAGTGFLPLAGGWADDRLVTLFAARAFRPRTESLERDESWPQLIAYVLLRRQTDGVAPLWHWYTRATGGEDRLTLKRSLGLGGHVNQDDERHTGFVGRRVMACVDRELAEEAGLKPGDWLGTVNLVGLVADQRDPVGRVHVGLVFITDLAPHAFPGRRDGIEAQGFNEAADLREFSDWEGWSGLILDAYVGC